MKHLVLIGSIATALSGAVSTVQAETIFGLSTANSIFSFDSATPGTVSAVIPLTGVTGSIVDIDFSPVNQLLYGLGINGDLYSIDTTTGAATLRLGVAAQLPANSITTPNVMDFNPAADRIRLFQGPSNFRLTGDVTTYDSAQTAGTVTNDQSLVYISGGSVSPSLVAAAYTNNFNGTGSTALFSIDTNTNNLVSHTNRVSGPPAGNFSDLTQVGTLGVAVGSNVGFDISALQGATTGYVTDDDTFYTINLASGSLTPVGTIGNGAVTTKSIAASTVPEPTTTALAAFGLLGFLGRRRR